MTAVELIRALLRRWYVVLLGVLLTAAVGATAAHERTVYYTHFEVVVLPPQEPPNPNTLRSGPYDLVPMAGVLVSAFNGGERPLQMSTSETTIYGEGMRRGHLVRLRNGSTSQWRPMFDRPVIDVQVVDPDPALVEQHARAITSKLRDILRDRQQALGVRPAARMTLEQSPADPVVEHVMGSRMRASGAVLLIGGWLTLLGVYWVARLAKGRRMRRERSGPGGGDSPGPGSGGATTAATTKEMVLQP